MRSPCLDRGDGLPCNLVNADKNNDVCENCKARLSYINDIGRCLSSSMPMDTTKQPKAKKMEEKKLCEKCGDNPPMSKSSKYCSPCLNSFKQAKKKATETLPTKKATSDKETPEKAPKTADAAVVIEFGKYASVLTEVEKLADEEMRPVDMQVIYMLKKQLDQKEAR